MKRSPAPAMRAVSLRLGAALLALYLGAMALLTISTTQYVLADLASNANALAARAGTFGHFSNDGATLRESDFPGDLDLCIDNALRLASYRVAPPNYSYANQEGFSLRLYRDAAQYAEVAHLVLGGDGNLLRESGDYLSFTYRTEEGRGAEEIGPDEGAAWIDLGADDSLAPLRRWEEANGLFLVATRRFTGYFDGTRFVPYAVAFLPEYAAAWEVLFDETAAATQPLVTVYASLPHLVTFDPAPVTLHGETYEDLRAVLRASLTTDERGTPHIDRGNALVSYTNCVFFSEQRYYRAEDLADYEARLAAAHEIVPFARPALVIVSALHANPPGIAMTFLRDVYLWSAAVAVVVFLSLRGAAKRHLVTPVAEVARGMGEGWPLLHAYREAHPALRETGALVDAYNDARTERQLGLNERSRLETALSYAKSAEERRRALVSDVAHELKTPLAVIHGYAEGLREDIAPDKREEYLDTILASSEHADAMVLEMLDLSRLEAGKVRLARDDFDLAALTRSVFAPLERAAEARGLTVRFDLEGPCMVSADEARLRQVVENLATNAVKYAAAGGSVRVIARQTRGKVHFRIENDCAPLPDDALRHVWDSFYRADNARSGEGTGLGLAIVRRIVELHGGSVFAENIANGVAFGFVL